jgi:hypothetical protein
MNSIMKRLNHHILKLLRLSFRGQIIQEGIILFRPGAVNGLTDKDLILNELIVQVISQFILK